MEVAARMFKAVADQRQVPIAEHFMAQPVTVVVVAVNRSSAPAVRRSRVMPSVMTGVMAGVSDCMMSAYVMAACMMSANAAGMPAAATHPPHAAAPKASHTAASEAASFEATASEAAATRPISCGNCRRLPGRICGRIRPNFSACGGNHEHRRGRGRQQAKNITHF